MFGTRLTALLAATVIAGVGIASAAQASIIYNINRTIGVGSVVGTITTDGTIGVLSNSNIEAWSITVTHPDLQAASPSTIFSNAGIGSGYIAGSALSATATQITFDFSASGEYFHLFNGNDIYWCNIANNGGCGSSNLNTAESLGYVSVNQPFEEAHTGLVVLASVDVPEAATLGLFGLGLAALGVASRRRKPD